VTHLALTSKREMFSSAEMGPWRTWGHPGDFEDTLGTPWGHPQDTLGPWRPRGDTGCDPLCAHQQVGEVLQWRGGTLGTLGTYLGSWGHPGDTLGTPWGHPGDMETPWGRGA